MDAAADRLGPPVRGSRPGVIGWLAGVTGLVVAFDLSTKILMVSTVEGGPPVRVIDGILYFFVTRNTGAAFSLGQGYTIVLTLTALVVAGVIIRFARRLHSVAWAVALGMILGGAVGNLIDRLFREPGPFRGAVVDFISVFHESGQVFPIFNIADSALVVGVGFAVLLELTGRQLGGGRVRDSQGDDQGDGSAQ